MRQLIALLGLGDYLAVYPTLDAALEARPLAR